MPPPTGDLFDQYGELLNHELRDFTEHDLCFIVNIIVLL